MQYIIDIIIYTHTEETSGGDEWIEKLRWNVEMMDGAPYKFSSSMREEKDST